MRSWGLAITRLSLAGWLGAAVFFVAVAIRPIRTPDLDSPQKALLAGILFPGYYAFGLSLLSVAWALILLLRPRRWGWQFTFVTLSLGLAIVDWFMIYSPLAEMTRLQWMEQAAPPASFRGYHIASMVINGIGILCGGVAAVLSCLPEESSNPT
ncbi:MAG: hypothetical protein JWM11_7468 [Planctomycetaceae bacterium]|nr:hypothetical protein [Planctomycetaceae bacterium]